MGGKRGTNRACHDRVLVITLEYERRKTMMYAIYKHGMTVDRWFLRYAFLTSGRAAKYLAQEKRLEPSAKVAMFRHSGFAPHLPGVRKDVPEGAIIR